MLKTHLNNFFCYLGRDIKNKSNLMRYDYYKVKRVIKSCQCEEHLDATNRLITLFYMKHSNDRLLEKLEKSYKLKQKKIRSK